MCSRPQPWQSRADDRGVYAEYAETPRATSNPLRTAACSAQSTHQTEAGGLKAVRNPWNGGDGMDDTPTEGAHEMEQQKAIKPQALEAITEQLKADYKHLMTLYNVSWRTPEDREDARQVLAKSVKDAKHAIQSVEGTQDAELRHWHDQLFIQVTLAEDAVNHPGTLKR
jgi:hypothetical protein